MDLWSQEQTKGRSHTSKGRKKDRLSWTLHGPSADFIPTLFMYLRRVNRLVLSTALGSTGGLQTINSGPCVSYQRAIDYRVDEYLMANLPQEIKTATAQKIASLPLVRVEDVWWWLGTAPRRFPLRPPAAFCVHVTASAMFMTLCVVLPHYIQLNWITLSVTLLLFLGQYTEVPQNAQVISTPQREKSFHKWSMQYKI